MACSCSTFPIWNLAYKPVCLKTHIPGIPRPWKYLIRLDPCSTSCSKVFIFPPPHVCDFSLRVTDLLLACKLPEHRSGSRWWATSLSVILAAAPFAPPPHPLTLVFWALAPPAQRVGYYPHGSPFHHLIYLKNWTDIWKQIPLPRPPCPVVVPSARTWLVLCVQILPLRRLSYRSPHIGHAGPRQRCLRHTICTVRHSLLETCFQSWHL